VDTRNGAERRKIGLSICGVNYVLLSERDEAYMRELGAQLEEKMKSLTRGSGSISATQAAVLCALLAMDETREAVIAAENLRARIQDYLEDAAQMKKEENRETKE
jgi:cell division protein ZapA (FtsZ GTPase activity inhibitor)